VFSLPTAFKNHQNSCLTSKHELSAILARSKDALATRKAAKKASLRANRTGNTSAGSLDALVSKPEGSNSMQVGGELPLTFSESAVS
jgi:hypothetical protein